MSINLGGIWYYMYHFTTHIIGIILCPLTLYCKINIYDYWSFLLYIFTCKLKMQWYSDRKCSSYSFLVLIFITADVVWDVTVIKAKLHCLTFYSTNSAQLHASLMKNWLYKGPSIWCMLNYSCTAVSLQFPENHCFLFYFHTLYFGTGHINEKRGKQSETT